ncbi:MAG: oligosaccharide flippase family protein, partial [Bacilli bacterium]|nr:oligosaccharide flippase family protein [Bacilli bacterium]
MKNNIRINVIVNIIRTIVLTFLSFITFPWVCRYLGDSSLGLYTWVNTFIAYFLILAKIGIPNLAVRECVKVRDDKEKLSNKVQTFFILQLISTVLSFGFMTTLVFSIPALRDSQALVFILAINFLAGAFSFEWVFIALEKQFYMSVRSIVALTIAAVLIIAFIRTPDDYLIYAL